MQPLPGLGSKPCHENFLSNLPWKGESYCSGLTFPGPPSTLAVGNERPVAPADQIF